MTASQKRLLAADSIVLIHYENTFDSVQGLRFLMERVNFDSLYVKRRKRLNREDQKSLSKLLASGERRDGRIAVPGWVSPTYGIMIYSRDMFSYIDVSFTPNKVYSCQGISFDNFDMNFDKWKMLVDFFRVHRIITDRLH